MSIYVNSDETIFRMINWMALLLHPDCDGECKVMYGDVTISFVDDNGVEMYMSDDSFCLWFNEETEFYIELNNNIRLIVSVVNGITHYSVDSPDAPECFITMDDYLSRVPSKLNELCEYIMGCGILTMCN